MRSQLKVRGILLGVAVCVLAAASPRAGDAVDPSCSGEQEVLMYMRDLKPRFTGADSADAEFRGRLDLQRVDSAALIEAITDTQTCSAVYDVVGPKLSRLPVPFRLAIVRLGQYYAVAVINATPPIAGIVDDSRTLVWILDASTLQVLHDNILM
jgi:hypothetical protein